MAVVAVDNKSIAYCIGMVFTALKPSNMSNDDVSFRFSVEIYTHISLIDIHLEMIIDIGWLKIKMDDKVI